MVLCGHDPNKKHLIPKYDILFVRIKCEHLNMRIVSSIIEQKKMIKMNEVKNKPKTEGKPVKDERIYIRVSLIGKERWEKYTNDKKFSSVSAMVRFAVEEMIESNFNRMTITQNPLEQEKKELDEMKEMHSELVEQLQDKIDQLQELTQLKIDEGIKGRILRHLELHPYTSEDLAYVLQEPEHEILIILNELQKQKIIKYNLDNTYEVI